MIASRRAASLGVLCAVMFLTFLDTTIVAVALASIQSSLHAGVADLQWVVGGYALAFGSLMLVFGSVGDRFGRKRVMLAGLAVFVAGSLVAALAVGPVMLIVGRIVMGLGAAASEPATLSIIRHLYPEDAARARALGVWSAVAGLALAVGPVIGGVLVGLGSWPAIFWFNVAAGALVWMLALISLRESTDPDVGRIDRAGSALGLLALGAAIFALIQGEDLGYGAGLIVASFAVAAVAFVAFVATELRSRNPMLNLK
jgi:MFS family permease